VTERQQESAWEVVPKPIGHLERIVAAVIGEAIVEPKDPVARPEAAVSDFEVQAAQDRRQRCTETTLGCLDFADVARSNGGSGSTNPAAFAAW